MNNLNILNAKALEKQIKVLETRINEVQKELDGLEKMRAACLILLGQDVEFPAAKVMTPAQVTAPAEAPKKPKAAKKAEKHEEAEEMEASEQESEEQEMSADTDESAVPEAEASSGDLNAPSNA